MRPLLVAFNLKREAAPVATSPNVARSKCFATFNLKREAAPVATGRQHQTDTILGCFNLKREAAPVATSCRGARWNQRCLFQSQTRSRPSCHAGMSQPTASQLQVSISNEKPPQLPLFLPQISARFTPLFQSQT